MPEPSADTPQLSLRDRLERIFHKPMTRREVVAAGAGAGLSLIATGVIGVPKFLQMEASLETSRKETNEARAGLEEAKDRVEKAQDRAQQAQEETAVLQKDLEKVNLSEERARIVADQAKIEKIESEKERGLALEEMSRLFVKDYDQNVKASNTLVDTYVYAQEVRKSGGNASSSGLELRIAFERAWLILERGVALTSAWQRLKGEKNPVGFDKDGRLIIEGKKLQVNEDVCDYHLALNLLRAKIDLASNNDSDKRALADEDIQNLLRFIDIRPKVDIEKTAWAVMPPDWAGALARFTIFLDERRIPPPQLYRIYRDVLLDGSRSGGGFYVGGKEKFPQASQFLQLGSRMDATVVFHEGGHYIADASSIKERLIGAGRLQGHADYQRDFDSLTARMQKTLLSAARKSGKNLGVWMSKSFVSAYASSNTAEDFAETFREFLGYGPAFREKIENLRKEDPIAASLLEVKYEFMRVNVAQGVEYGMNGRKAGAPLLFEDKEKIKGRNSKLNSLASLLEETGKRFTEYLSRESAFKNAQGKLVIPESDFDLDTALLEPRIWNDIIDSFRGEVIDVSSVVPVPHYEFQGVADIAVKLKNDKTVRLILDTRISESAQSLIKLIPEFTDKEIIKTRMVNNDRGRFSQESLDYFKAQGVKSPHVAFSGIWESSYPPSHVDREGVLFVRFQYENGEWKQKPLDVRRTNLFIKSVADGKEEVRSSGYHTITLGEKDILFGFNIDGNLREVRTHNI
ncbi:MAG: hypothetical protein G01um10145_543 [Microgenomates group bacterium Gr01-1014_5]|nr:MAG: hypothetical protein G01um10145_543 [Microgenomates group bacterium Gr01-1014_5]